MGINRKEKEVVDEMEEEVIERENMGMNRDGKEEDDRSR